MDNQQEVPDMMNASNPLPPKRRRRRWWLLVIPLLAWLACLGLVAYMVVLPLFQERQSTDIPVTGVDPSQPTAVAPTQPPANQGKPVTGDEYMNLAMQRLQTCTSSFHDYFVLEQLAVDQPDVFTDDNWRSDVTNAMQSFRADCQQLGTLPSAPSAYTEVDHWLKLAAGEVGPSADSLKKAIDQDRAEQFQVSVEHLLKFVDYIHNAEGAMDGMKQRKEI